MFSFFKLTASVFFMILLFIVSNLSAMIPRPTYYHESMEIPKENYLDVEKYYRKDITEQEERSCKYNMLRAKILETIMEQPKGSTNEFDFGFNAKNVIIKLKKLDFFNTELYRKVIKSIDLQEKEDAECILRDKEYLIETLEKLYLSN